MPWLNPLAWWPARPGQRFPDRAAAGQALAARLAISERLGAIGLWYEDFRQTSDDEVRALLQQSV